MYPTRFRLRLGRTGARIGIERSTWTPLVPDTAYTDTSCDKFVVVQAGIERWTDGEFSRGDFDFAHGVSRQEIQ